MDGPFRIRGREEARGPIAGFRTLLLFTLLALILVGGCRKHEPVLEDLKSLEEFKARFNEDEGKPRIVLLLSPT
jgi:hypothetical protein